MLDWKPASGQVALIEMPDGGDDCLTGVVMDGDGAVVVIDLGASPRPAGRSSEVVASFFSPDALYRIEGTLSRGRTRSTVDLAIRDVERVQRRVVTRTTLAVPVALSNLDDPDPDASIGAFASVSGESIDISEGGCRVVVDRRFPSGCDPTVTLHLSSEETLVALAAMLEETRQKDGRFEYRLVFTDQEDGHRELLAAFIADANLRQPQ